MKKILFIIALLFNFYTNIAQEVETIPAEEITTYYFIRHAEKDLTNYNDRNPNLSDIGLQRAKNWAEILKEVSFDAIYSTDYFRTTQTAKPIAKNKNLSITIYDLNAFDLNKFKNVTRGKTILVVGHSNTTPNFVNSFIGRKKYNQISEKNYSNIYILTIIGTSVSDKLLTIN